MDKKDNNLEVGDIVVAQIEHDLVPVDGRAIRILDISNQGSYKAEYVIPQGARFAGLFTLWDKNDPKKVG
jgi:hypothetical protein